MPTLDPRIDTYIEQAPAFARPMLTRIRKAFHRGCPDVVESIKWRSPAFESDGMLGTMAAFKQHVSYGFWRGSELDDPEGLFRDVGDTGMCAHKPRSLKDLPTQSVLADYVRRATALNREHTAAAAPAPKRAAKRPAPKTPADLAAALERSATARKTFDGFPPSQKREYVAWITDAKRDATRAKRIATAIEWMGEGKRRNWKYEGTC